MAVRVALPSPRELGRRYLHTNRSSLWPRVAACERRFQVLHTIDNRGTGQREPLP